MIEPEGTQKWFQHGKLHRAFNRPAVVYTDGTQVWYVNDKRHRDDGLPALIDVRGHMDWYMNDIWLGDQVKPPPGAIFPGQLIKNAAKWT